MEAPLWSEGASAFAHEREALAFVKALLPNHEPYRAWTNVEFIAGDGSVKSICWPSRGAGSSSWIKSPSPTLKPLLSRGFCVSGRAFSTRSLPLRAQLKCAYAVRTALSTGLRHVECPSSRPRSRRPSRPGVPAPQTPASRVEQLVESRRLSVLHQTSQEALLERLARGSHPSSEGGVDLS